MHNLSPVNWYSFNRLQVDEKLSELWSEQARIWTQSAEMRSASDTHYTTRVINGIKEENSEMNSWDELEQVYPLSLQISVPICSVPDWNPASTETCI